MGLVHSPKIVTDGLLLCLDAGNAKSYIGSGTTWTDLSPRKYNGALTNGPTFSSENGGTLVFDGIDDYISLASPSRRFAWAPAGTTGNRILSIEFWAKSSDGTGYYISKPWNGFGNYNYNITGTTFITQVSTLHSSTFSSISNGKWNHVVAIMNETQKAVYVNGVIASAYTNHNETSDTPTSGDSTLALSLMTLYPYGSGGFNQPTHAIAGNMAVCKIYNRELTAAEVQQNFNALRGRFGI